MNRVSQLAAKLVAALTGLKIATARDVTDHQKIEQGPQVALEQYAFQRISREFFFPLVEELIQ